MTKFAAEILRDEEKTHDGAANEIADDQLQEAEVLVVGEAGDADDGEGTGLRCDDGERNSPPRDGVSGEEIVFERALRALETETEEGDADQVHGDHGEI